MPQWSPVMKTGNTWGADAAQEASIAPQWSPVMKTGNTGQGLDQARQLPRASMEPGHEDREYAPGVEQRSPLGLPQWSPVMKTGNTRSRARTVCGYLVPQWSPVMKTGNTWIMTMLITSIDAKPQWSPVMKTGNTRTTLYNGVDSFRLNGARS